MYSTNLGWVEHWSKSGDQGEDWQMAAVAIDSADSSKVKFVVYTGWDYSSDVAIDDVNITLRSTPAPSVTASPSNTPSPTLTPSPAPTHAPTTLLASTSMQLQSALGASGNTISMGSDITLSSALIVSNVTAISIYGNTYEVNGGNEVRCFTILDAEILISDLVISNGFSPGYGGGMYINGSSKVTLLGCSFSQNEVNVVSGGAIFANGAQDPSSNIAENGKYMSIVIRNCNFTENLGAFGGAIRFNFQVHNATSIFLMLPKTDECSLFVSF